MAEDLKAEATIELETSSLKKGSSDIQKEFKEIDKSGSKAADNVSDSLDDMGGAATKAGSDIKSGADKGERALDDLGDAADDTSGNMSTLSVSIFGLGDAISGVADTIFGFNEKFVALEKSAFGVEETTRDLIRAAEDLNAAMNNGTLVGQDLTRAIEDLDFIYRKLEIEQKEVIAEQQALNSEFVGFGLSLTQTVAFSILTVNELMKSNIIEQIRMKGATLASSGALRALGFNFKAAGIAMKGATFSLMGLRAGIRATMLALGPIGIAMVGISSAMIIWETNAFGVQEKMAELWDLLKNMLPIFQVLETAVKGIFPEASAEVEEFDAAVDGAKFTTEELIEMLEDGKISADEFAISVKDAQGNMGSFTNEAENMATSLGEDLQPSLAGISSQLKTVGTEARNAGKELDEFKKKRESISAARDFRDLSREDQDLSLIGKTGTFSRVGTNILGFRGPEFSSGGRTFRSRITSKNFTLGGQASQAIAAFQSQPTPIGPGTPAHILGRIRKRDAFMSSLAGAILAALGRRGLGRKASRAYDRAGVWPVVAIVREGIEKGFLTMGYVRELLENTSSANGAAGVISSLAAQVQQLDEENEARLLQISEDSGLSVSDISNLEKTEEGILQINQAILDTETQKGIDAFNAEQAAIQSSIDLRGITSFDQREKLISSMM